MLSEKSPLALLLVIAVAAYILVLEVVSHVVSRRFESQMQRVVR
jgi:hypothetical protein